jgi:hypothetical protein
LGRSLNCILLTRNIHIIFFYRFLQSPFYHVLIILVTLSNACVTASISFKHTPDQKPREHFFQYQKKLEIGFTIFYDLEVFFKIFCFSFNGYIDRTIHKFELILAIMTTIHVLPINGLFLSWISIFQVCKFCIGNHVLECTYLLCKRAWSVKWLETHGWIF